MITASLALRDGSISTGNMPQTNDLYQKYMRLEFPEFEAIARANPWSKTASITADGRRARVVAVAVDPEFLDIFDLPFIAGDARTALATPDGVLLSEAAAVRLYGTRDVLGKTISLGGNRIDATVKGVIGKIREPSHIGNSRSASLNFEMIAPWDLYDRLRQSFNTPPAPPTNAKPSDAAATSSAANASKPAGGDKAADKGAASAEPPDAAPPETQPQQQNENWLGGYCCTTYAMLKRDSHVTRASIDARMRDFVTRHMTPEQLKLASVQAGAVPLSGMMVTQLDAQLLGGSRGAISITTLLLGLGSLVLLVACVNYANLATARATRRAREIGLRKVIGARRSQLVAQYLLEAGVLTMAALAIACGIVAVLARPVYDAIGIDMRTGTFGDAGFWLFVAALLVVVTLLGGAYPAFVLSRARPIEALRIGRVRLGPRFASTLLVGAQFTAASFLLIAVIVMYSQNAALARTGLGATRDQQLVIDNFAPVTGVDGELLRGELERLPQVKSVTAMTSTPWGDNVNLNLLSRSPEETTTPITAFQNNVGYDFFATFDIPVLAGRVFDRAHSDLPPAEPGSKRSGAGAADQCRDRPRARAAARLRLAGGGRRPDGLLPGPARTTRAAVRDHRRRREPPAVSCAASARRRTSTSSRRVRACTSIVVRLAADDISGGVAAVEAAWRKISPQAPLQRRFVDDLFNENFEKFARLSQVFVGLTAFAFFISIIGLFGMAVQVAGRRIHEIGVRKSVGARKSQIVLMLLRDFSKPVLIANLIAWPLGYRRRADVSARVHPADPDHAAAVRRELSRSCS